MTIFIFRESNSRRCGVSVRNSGRGLRAFIILPRLLFSKVLESKGKIDEDEFRKKVKALLQLRKELLTGR